MLEEESHGFSIDGTAKGLRYGRVGSLRYNGLPWFCRFHYEISGLKPYRAFANKGGTGEEPYLPAEIVSPSSPRSAQPGW